MVTQNGSTIGTDELPDETTAGLFASVVECSLWTVEFVRYGNSSIRKQIL